MSELSKEVLTDHFGPWAAKLWVPKVKDHEKKIAKIPQLTFSEILHSKSLLFGRPGFDSRRAPTLGTHSFGAHGPNLTYNTSFESPNIFLYENFKKLT